MLHRSRSPRDHDRRVASEKEEDRGPIPKAEEEKPQGRKRLIDQDREENGDGLMASFGWPVIRNFRTPLTLLEQIANVTVYLADLKSRM
jgi:hypothetical protein